MPPAKAEVNGNGTTAEVTSDLVVVGHEESNNENAGGQARRKGEVNGSNGHTANEERVEWHRGLVDFYKQIEKGAVDGMEVVQATTTKTGKDLEKLQEDLDEELEKLQDETQKQLNNLTDLFTGGGEKRDDAGDAQAAELVERELGLKPGPTITLHCIDNMDGKFKALEMRVDWIDSWEDVLQKLKEAFKRDVIFEYEVGGRVLRVQDDGSFDRAMALAEGSGNKLYVVIQQAVWAEPVMEEIEPEEPEPEEEPLIVTCADRLAYSPVPYKPLLLLGSLGLITAIAMCVGGISLFGNDGTYMLALSLTIPVPYFIHGFTVARSQPVEPTVIKCLVASVGTAMGLIVILSYSQLPATDGMIGAAVWSLATSFYLWVSYPLFPAFYAEFKNPKKKKKRKLTQAQEREQLWARIYMWLGLMLYSGFYLTLQSTPLLHATNLVTLEQTYTPMGRLVPRNAKGGRNHLFCLGFTDPDAVVDNRPVVVFEAMEGLGQALAVAGVQEKVARVGIACAYDRAGFGWSDPPAVDDRRGPENIAEELHFMLMQNNISVLIPPRTGEIEPQVKFVEPPFVLVGHSVGSLYMRTFAKNYPKRVAAVVQWDPLPSQDAQLGEKYLASATVRVLNDFMLTLCTYYLEPMGLIDVFLRSLLITPLLNGTSMAKPKAEGGIGDDLDRMTARMLKRNWCPSVAKEHADLYQGGKPGISTVVEADNNGYDTPFVVWTRRVSVYAGMKDEYDHNYTIDGEDACGKDSTGIADPTMNHPEGTRGWACVGFKVLSYSRMPYKNPHKRTCEVEGQPQKGSNNPCPDILRSNKDPDPPASELAPMQGPLVQAQLVDTVLNAWHMLTPPVFTEFPSAPMAFAMQAFLPLDEDAFRLQFTEDMREVLGARFQDTVRVVVVGGPTLCPASSAGRPDMLGQLMPGDCPRSTCMDLRMCSSPWDTSQGLLVRRRAAYRDAAASAGSSLTYHPTRPESSSATDAAGWRWPLRRHGLTAKTSDETRAFGGREDAGKTEMRAFTEKAFYLVFKLVGYKDSAVQAAVDVLVCLRSDCKERQLDATEARKTSPNTTITRQAERDRRDALFDKYDVSTVVLGERLLSNNSWVVSVQAVLKQCPNGTFTEGKGCRQCPANATSAKGSQEQTKCQCDTNYFLEVINDDWVCTHCPPNSRSKCGSTLRTDCKCNPGYYGKDGQDCTPCPLNTYKALVGDYPCTNCNATQAGCPVPLYPNTPDNLPLTLALATCHPAPVSVPGGVSGLVQHGRFGQILTGPDWGTNCTIGAPTIDACTNSTDASFEDSGVMLGNYDAAACASPAIKEAPYSFIASDGQIVMQRCLSRNVFGCSVFANLSLQHWPVETECRQCEAQDGSPMCCFSKHTVRDCSAAYPGGAPGHCDEVPALTLKERDNIIEFCEASEDSNATRRGGVAVSSGVRRIEGESGGIGEEPGCCGDFTSEEVAWRGEKAQKEELMRRQERQRLRQRQENRHRKWIQGDLAAYQRKGDTHD